MNYGKCVQDAIVLLKNAGVADSECDARAILEYVAGIDRTKYIFCRDKEMPTDEAEKYMSLINRRANREPLQHIIGNANFYGYEYKVSPDVLVPRFDTEILVERVLEVALDYSDIRILDMCTGSGCIAITLFLEISKYGKCNITASDVSDKALSIASINAHNLIGDNDNFNIVKSDMYDNLDTSVTYDIIVSNPPYIPTDEIDKLDAEVRDYDPLLALDGGEDGLKFYRTIIGNSPMYLNNNGYLFMEIGYNQGIDVSQLMRDKGYYDIKIYKDLAGYDRVIGARLSSKVSD